MALAYVHEFEVGADRSTTNYDAIRARLRLEENPAPGLIMHTSGFHGGKFQMLEVWESAEDQERFERERLLPAVAAAVANPGPPPETHSYELHNLIVGS